MPPISTWTPSTQIARRAALLATGGLATYGLCMWLAGPTLGVPRPRIATVFGAIVLLNFVLALTAESWAHQRSAGYVFGVGLQVLVSAVLSVSGGIGASFLVFVYLFPIFHTAMIGPTSAIFVTANAGVLLYGALVALEMNGLMPPAGTLRWDIDATPVPVPGEVAPRSGICALFLWSRPSESTRCSQERCGKAAQGG
jgi:hypothetical protein